MKCMAFPIHEDPLRGSRLGTGFTPMAAEPSRHTGYPSAASFSAVVIHLRQLGNQYFPQLRRNVGICPETADQFRGETGIVPEEVHQVRILLRIRAFALPVLLIQQANLLFLSRIQEIGEVGEVLDTWAYVSLVLEIR